MNWLCGLHEGRRIEIMSESKCTKSVLPKAIRKKREPPKSLWGGGLQQQHDPQDCAVTWDGRNFFYTYQSPALESWGRGKGVLRVRRANMLKRKKKKWAVPTFITKAEVPVFFFSFTVLGGPPGTSSSPALEAGKKNKKKKHSQQQHNPGGSIAAFPLSAP